MITLWDVEGGLPQIDKYLYSRDNHVVAGVVNSVHCLPAECLSCAMYLDLPVAETPLVAQSICSPVMLQSISSDGSTLHCNAYASTGEQLIFHDLGIHMTFRTGHLKSGRND